MNKEQLEKLSDLQINRLIAVIEGHKLDKLVIINQDNNKLDETSYKDDAVTYPHEISGRSFLNYCNNWSDMGPLIDSSQIKIDPRKSLAKLGWMASYDDERYSISKNPLRAAAIVYLLMQGEE